jgi:TonB family protein
MPQRSLLFSSDPETSRRLAQALRELGFSVDHCPEIFAAVERITTHSFELIITDWDDGVEAMFLIKTARELKCNHDAFRIVVAKPAAAVAAKQAGAQIVIPKPVLPGHTKYALLTSDDFMGRMKGWAPALAIQNVPAPPKVAVVPVAPPPPIPGPPKKSWMQEQRPISDEEVGMNLTFGVLERDNFFNRLGIPFDAIPAKAKPRLRLFVWGAALVSAGLTGYVFSGALKARASSTRALGEVRLASSAQPEVAPAVQLKPTESRLTIRVTPARTEPKRETPSEAAKEELATNQAPAAQSLPEPEAAPPVADRPSIPASLASPMEPELGARASAIKPTSSLMSDVEPINLTEDLAEKMLLQRVLPNYPAQALRSKLQGAVLLQAWIRKDGTVRDLKVINGPLVLCQAAYSAVKQWRYKPYVMNGQMMEAQTFVTVNFRLP